MPDINQINGLVLCDEISVNGVTIANILNIDNITKNCGGDDCNAIQLARSTESCEEACASRCATYYTNASGAPAAGDYIYQTEECNCDGEQPEVGIY